MLSCQGPVSVENLEKSVCRLSHRGPDGQATWIAASQKVGLGHARLSIIDLEGGWQPLHNEDQSVHIIVNGEFYGYERIREELQVRGHKFSTASDSEILVHLYEECGTNCLKCLRGEFAFVLWDDRKQELFAARDRFGIKPLFYTQVNGVLYLASEVKALFAAGVPAGWDCESFYQQLFIYPNQDRTLYKGVRQLPPGHFLIASEQRQIRIQRYWDLDYPRQADISPENEAECVDQVQHKLREAVRLRLRADVPVGCFLSGGLDSSAILGLAASEYPDSMCAYNISFDQIEFDEKEIARETAEQAGAQFASIPVSHSDIADYLAQTVVQGETVGVNWHAVARYLLCRAIHNRGLKVVLSGEGADEVFAGYVQFRQDLLLNQPASPGLNETAIGNNNGCAAAPDGNGSTPLGTPQLLDVVHRVLGFVPSWLKKLALGRSIFHLLLAPGYCAEWGRNNPFEIFMSQFDIQGQLQHRHPLVQSLYLWSRSILPNYTLFAERLEMAHAVEVRIPYLDHELFELVRKLSPGMLIRGVKEKYILREATRQYLTATVYARRKHPFFAPPLPSDAKNRLQTFVQDTLRSAALASLPFFDRNAVIALLDKIPDMDSSVRTSLDPAIMMLMCACILQSHYKLC